ncbi:MAG: hypothetical protein P8Y45_11405 [Exilibacterium sp.]
MNKGTRSIVGRLCMGLISAMLFSALAGAVEPERPVSDTDTVSSPISSQASNAESIVAFQTLEPRYSLTCIENCYETTGDWVLCVALCSGSTNR